MTDISPRFSLPFILPGQAQKELFYNEALTAIDCALHACAENAGEADPPPEPDLGQTWIVNEGASGAWSGRVDCLATWTAGGWRFTSPVPGMTVWNKISGRWMVWTGEAWVDGILPAAAITIDGDQIVGPRQPDIPLPVGGMTIDAEARISVAALIATLKSHGLIE